MECSFSDFDELTDAIRGWQLELFKLDSNPFQGRFFQLMDSDFILTRAYFSSCMKAEGAPPVGFRSFVVPVDPRLEMIWRGQRISGSDLLVFPTGSGLHALSERNFNVYTLSVFDEALFDTASRLGVPEIEAILRKREVIHCQPSKMAKPAECLAT